MSIPIHAPSQSQLEKIFSSETQNHSSHVGRMMNAAGERLIARISEQTTSEKGLQEVANRIKDLAVIASVDPGFAEELSILQDYKADDVIKVVEHCLACDYRENFARLSEIPKEESETTGMAAQKVLDAVTGKLDQAERKDAVRTIEKGTAVYAKIIADSIR